MMRDTGLKQWQEYVAEEKKVILPILARHGFVLDDEQPHLGGERYLMQAVTTTSGKKLILLATRASDGTRVVIKATTDKNGARELIHERKCRMVLHEINFAYDVFFSPEELAFIREHGVTISIQAFIEQECSFLERPISEQFMLVLRAFKAQESAHATTYNHLQVIKKTFDQKDADAYLSAFSTFIQNIEHHHGANKALIELLKDASTYLATHEQTIEQYCGFLTHTDFVPHNIRVRDDTIYLLDYSSLRFGNKYEGWARFINFMDLYNPELSWALVQYVRDNRTPEESQALKLMRIYRLGEIIWYYTSILPKSTGNLLTLNRARIEFWTEVLRAVMADKKISLDVVEGYRETRDSLRSDDEKKRQIGLH